MDRYLVVVTVLDHETSRFYVEVPFGSTGHDVHQAILQKRAEMHLSNAGVHFNVKKTN